MIKKTLTALLLSGAFASAHADVLLQQNFDNINALPGWVMTNASTPTGLTGWFQGDQQIFTAHSGPAPEAYLAANYNNAVAGGVISNWLITPQFSTETAVAVSLWLRGFDESGFFDQVTFGFSNGGAAIGDFSVSPAITVATNGWTLYTVNLAAQGAGSMGRFAIQYTNLADFASYIGVDDLKVESRGDGGKVPEPATMLLMASGMIGLAAARRRRQRG
jgi:hypothetical protein